LTAGSLVAVPPPNWAAHHEAQPNPPDPQAGGLHAGPELLPEVMTLTEVKARVTSAAPHFSHTGLAPSEYAVMDIRTSKRAPQA
jgi:hypothetical protein